MQLINKKILITGATSGIGLKLVEKLYPKNKLFIIARNQNKINELQINFPDIIVYTADFKNISELQNVVKQLQLATLSLDVLINNAAVQYTPTFIDSDFKSSPLTMKSPLISPPYAACVIYCCRC